MWTPTYRIEEVAGKRDDHFDDYIVHQLGADPSFFESPAAMVSLMERYDAGIRHVDDHVKALWTFFEDEGINDRTLWIITADHGEGLGNHSYRYHAWELYQEQVRVPLIFYSKRPLFPKGRREQVIRSIDLLPTLADLMGYDLSRESVSLRGKSFLAVLRGERDPFGPRTALIEREWLIPDDQKNVKHPHFKHMLAVVEGAMKYIYRSDGEDRLFDLSRDPLEQRNLITTQGEWARRLRARLEGLELGEGDGVSPRGDAGLDEETREVLKALGYL